MAASPSSPSSSSAGSPAATPGGTPVRLMDRRRGTDFYNGLNRSTSSVDIAGKPAVSLDDLSWPPTEAELSSYVDVAVPDLPTKYKRPINERVFVNREVALENIKAFGFDMDHTLAIYESPVFDELTYKLAQAELRKMGYPAYISDFVYDHSFAIRGLMLDTEEGNFIKLDAFGGILAVVHGKRTFSKEEAAAKYPTMFVHSDDIGAGRRFYVMDTLYSACETCLYSDIIASIDPASPLSSDENRRQMLGNLEIAYLNLFLDVRSAIDKIHNSGALKNATLANMPLYIRKQPNLAALLMRMRRTAKVFLLTNSHYEYSDAVMDYLLSGSYDDTHKNWRDFFDVVIVAARKPAFFEKGSIFREVDRATGNLKVGVVEHFRDPNAVYAGGNLETFSQLLNVHGGEVLYIGDHIFGDIIRSKDKGWKTLLVVREMDEEIETRAETTSGYRHLRNLEFILAEVYRGFDSSAETPPDVTAVVKHIKAGIQKVNNAYNPTFGPIFRHGNKQTFFAMQVKRYSDLYASSFNNLLSYPLFYRFTNYDDPLPHERDLEAAMN